MWPCKQSGCSLQSRLRRTSTAEEQPSVGRATRASRLRGASESSNDYSAQASLLAEDSGESSKPSEDAEEASDASEPLPPAGEGSPLTVPVQDWHAACLSHVLPYTQLRVVLLLGTGAFQTDLAAGTSWLSVDIGRVTDRAGA